MYYSNYDEFKKPERKEKYIMYFTSIGAFADEKLNQMFTRLYLHNPRIRRTKYGNLNATKYSFEFKNELAMEMVKRNILNMFRLEFHDGIKLLTENKKNWYIINDIIYS